MDKQKVKLTVVSEPDSESKLKDSGPNYEHIRNKNESYHSNPLYEKLVKYNIEQKRKRFTVEDLLR